MRNIWKGTDCTSLPRNLWYSNRKWKCIDDDFASSFCKIGIDCAFTISSTKSTPLLFLSFEYSADSIDSRWLLKKISEISVRRASLPIPRAVVVYSSRSFAKFHSRFDAHFSIVSFSRGENGNSNVLPARKKERERERWMKNGYERVDLLSRPDKSSSTSHWHVSFRSFLLLFCFVPSARLWSFRRDDKINGSVNPDERFARRSSFLLFFFLFLFTLETRREYTEEASKWHRNYMSLFLGREKKKERVLDTNG